jgi:D-alanyl-D-alanine carboxypeptidase
MMNDMAARIGMTGTNFTNPHGLFEVDNYTTVRDLFLLTQWAFNRHPTEFGNLVAETEWAMEPNSNNPQGYTEHNTNWMIRSGSRYFCEYVFGVKTGGLPYIRRQNADGSWTGIDTGTGIANLVSVAARDGFEYIIVTAEAPHHTGRENGERALHHAFNDHRALYDWAFASFDYVTVLRRTDPVRHIRITGGTEDRLNLFPQMEDEFRALLPRNHDIDSLIQIVPILVNDEVAAPVLAGAILGRVEIMLMDEVLETFPLITNQSVEQTQGESLRAWLRSTFFTERPSRIPDGREAGAVEYRLKTGWLLLLIGLAVLIIGLIVLQYIRKYRKKQSERNRFGNSGSGKKKPPNRRIRR